MDPEEYRDARWYSLVRTAIDLGVPEEDAPALVQGVLRAKRRRIRRAEDPDPLVREALAAAVLGPTERRRSRWPAVVAVAVLLAGTGLVATLTRPDEPPVDHLRDDQVPSLFGFDAADAEHLLEDRGLEVTLTPMHACEVKDRVVGSDPAVGATYHRGDPITVYTAVPAYVACLTGYQDRDTAWQLLDFANDRGPAPPFAARVVVYPGDAPAVVLSRAAAADPASWADTGVLDVLRAASTRVQLVSEHPLQYAVPAIRIIPTTDDLGRCGAPDTSVTGSARAFSVQIQSPDRSGCPARVDIYREGPGFDSPVDALALYSPAS